MDLSTLQKLVIAKKVVTGHLADGRECTIQYGLVGDPYIWGCAVGCDNAFRAHWMNSGNFYTIVAEALSRGIALRTIQLDA